jgi:hypothetical protein
MYHGHGNLFGRTRWTSQVTWVKWKLILVHLEIVSISTQERCTVCAERAIGSEIILGTTDGILRDMGQMEAHFSLFGDSANLNDAR